MSKEFFNRSRDQLQPSLLMSIQTEKITDILSLISSEKVA